MDFVDVASRRLRAILRVACVLLPGACALFSPEHGDPVSIIWTRPLTSGQGGWLGRAALDQQTAFIQDGGWLKALSLGTGAVTWQRQLRVGIPINAENVLLTGNLVIVAGGDSVRALDRTSGAPKWAHLPDGNVASCEIAAAGSLVFVGSRIPSVTALSTDSGHVRWRASLGPGWTHQAIVTGIAVSGDTVYASVIQFLDQNGAHRTGHIVALDAASGAELWRYTSAGDSTDVHGAPAVTATSVLLGDVFGRSFFALDRFTGQPRWRIWTPRQFPGVHHTPVVRGDTVFAAAQGGVYAVRESSGQILWNRLDVLGGSDVARCGNVLLVQDLQIDALDPSSGTTRGSVLESVGTEVVTSRIAVTASRALVTGYEGVYALRCN